MGNDGSVFEEYGRKTIYLRPLTLVEIIMMIQNIAFLMKTIDATSHSQTDKSHHLSDIKICCSKNRERKKSIANHLKLLI